MTILCEPEHERALDLRGLMTGAFEIVHTLGRTLDLVDVLPGRQLVVLGPGVELDQAIGFMRLVRAVRPDTVVLLIRSQPTPADEQLARRAGIAALLPADDDELIAHACRTALEAADQVGAASTSGNRGQLVTVLSARGGCGSTTVATNLATALQLGGRRQVCLVDLDLEVGDVAAALQLDTGRTIANALGTGDQLDLATLVSSTSDGLDCVLAPAGAGEAKRVSSELVSRLFDALAARYDLIVVDLPARLTAAALVGLDRAEHHVVVSTPERPALRNLRRTLDTLDLLGYARASRSVVFNRSDAGVAITAADVEALLRAPVAVHVPSSRAVPASINRGQPLVAGAREHPVSIAIGRLAERLTAFLATGQRAAPPAERDSA